MESIYTVYFFDGAIRNMNKDYLRMVQKPLISSVTKKYIPIEMKEYVKEMEVILYPLCDGFPFILTEDDREVCNYLN